MAKKKGAGGRPTKYMPEFVELVENICSMFPATDEDLAKICRVDVSTIGNWKNEHPEFLEAIKRGKNYKDLEVEESLFQRAKGYKRNIQRVTKDGDVIDCEEEMPPDTTACIFWLKNRQRERWRDKQEHEHSGTIQHQAVLRIGNSAEEE